MSGSRIFADAVPGGGGGGSVYTETWTVSSSTTTSSSATNTSKQKLVYTVDGEDVLISVVIGGTSILIGRISNTRKKPDEESPKEHKNNGIMLASDLDAFTPEMKNQLLKDIKNQIDQKRKDREIDAETLKERLDAFEKLKNSPHFDDAIQILRDMREDLTLDNLQEKVEDLEAKSQELKDLKQCPKCNKPVQATPYKGPSDFSVQWYHHQDPSGGRGDNWCVIREDDQSAFDHWRRERNLPTMQTHCKCAYCGTMHRRNDIIPSNGFFQRCFLYGPKFKCQNPKCGQEQWVPKTNRWEDETVAVFVR